MKVLAAKPYFSPEDIENILSDIKQCLEAGSLTFGPFVRKFEKMFAEYIGVKNAIAVNSGTSALEIALRYFNIKDREVIVPTNSFVASANTVIYAGGKPVLADIKSDTLDLDPEDVLRKITDKTKGVMVVHLAGLICPEMRELKKICEDRGLFLIEDAAQAQGATFDGKKAGSLSDVGCFSFFPTKVMTTGEGGMITTDNDEVADLARSLRHHGREGVLHTRLGYNWRMSDINAVLGIYQLKRLEEFVKERNRIAKRYNQGLEAIKAVEPFSVPPNIRHCYYKYPVLLKGELYASELQKILQEKYDIATATLYQPPIHLQPLYRNLFGYKEGDLPGAEEVLKRELCLPLFVGIIEDEIDYVLEALEKEVR
ncbi:MAG: DegT/DnrJ/EryC1/StrS family aminotransferase [Candidatus Saganbacteria bacterium]|nr:DegT/DnrJ/EryC1/StrS family aminotransferase [Candidatus Saganbacteria bacterium]